MKNLHLLLILLLSVAIFSCKDNPKKESIQEQEQKAEKVSDEDKFLGVYRYDEKSKWVDMSYLIEISKSSKKDQYSVLFKENGTFNKRPKNTEEIYLLNYEPSVRGFINPMFNMALFTLSEDFSTLKYNKKTFKKISPE